MITITGYLRFIPHPASYYFDHESGQVSHVVFATEEQGRSVPINKLIALSVTPFDHQGGLLLYQATKEEPCYTLVTTPLADQNQLKHVAVIVCAKLDSTDEEITEKQKKADDWAQFMEYYYQYFSPFTWDVEMRGYVMLYEGATTPPLYAKTAVNNLIASGVMGEFDPNYIHIVGGAANYCGQATLGGNRSVTYQEGRSYVCGVGTAVHELGHNFWLHHAGRRKIDGTETEYGDQSSVMGGDHEPPEGMHSWHMVQLGWYKDREIKIVDSSQEILVSPIEMPYHNMHPKQYQHVVIRKPGNYDTYISLRKVRGTRYPQNTSTKGKLYVHKLDGDKRTKRIEPDMGIGSQRILDNGISVSYEAYDHNTETAKVVVLFNEGDSVASIPMPQGFPTPIPSADVNKSNSGAWFFREFNGQGYDIYIREDGETIMFWYTYENSSSGLPRWYTAHGNKVGNQVLLDIYTATGGTFNDPASHTLINVGTGQLYFLDSDRGVFNWSTTEHDCGGVEIEPILLTNNELDGAWYQKDKNGSGFGWRFYERDGQKQCVGYWYTFDDNGKQRWYLCNGINPVAIDDSEPFGTGSFGGDGDSDAYEVTLTEFTGGRWMFYDEPVASHVGTGFLSITEEGLKFEYHVNGIDVEDEGILNLVRLF